MQKLVIHIGETHNEDIIPTKAFLRESRGLVAITIKKKELQCRNKDDTDS